MSDTSTPLHTVQQLRPATLAQGDLFGVSVSVDGNRMAVGAINVDVVDAGGKMQRDAGAVFVFERVGDRWVEESRVIATEPRTNDNFGFSVALDGRSLAVGAWHADVDRAFGAGRVHLYSRFGSEWRQDSVLATPTPQPKSEFGVSLDLDADLLVVGAQHHDVGSIADAGAAFLYERIDGEWRLRRRLLADAPTAGDRFGRSVRLDGPAIVIGAPGQGSSKPGGSGSVHVYRERSDGDWSWSEAIRLPDGSDDDRFGSAVAIDGQAVAIGARKLDPSGEVSGSVHLFDFEDGGWRYATALSSAAAAGRDRFGASLSLAGDLLLVGAPLEDVDASVDTGVAYLYRRGDSGWSILRELTAPLLDAGAQFGRSVALAGTVSVVGAEQSSTYRSGGAAYVFPAETRE